MASVGEGRLAGKIAMVTGAANGIGRASALRLAREGADLVVIDREAEPLREAARAIEAAGRRALPIVADWTDAAAVRDAVAAARGAVGRIDILFNNVGQSARERASEFHLSVEDTWRFVIEVSLLTTMRATRLVVEEMRARRSGRIVNMSTESAFYGDVGFVDYAAAKMGVVGFTRSLARELAPFHVNVNAVCPGAIRTRAHDRLPKEVIDKVRTSVPMGYVAEPEDVAGVVAFLASDDARYITGQSILIDGGRWMI
ncbi:MAG TPA: SDR family NAD(P)-dependent oxidoreductase [Methylomirabilota bacterium]|nr:SDR family NAD(P)-dependent oxidoreductase [Methylomirabilota bacterium]